VARPYNTRQYGDMQMRFVVLVPASKESEAGVLPGPELLQEMG
jgi:hypothetical protein